MWHDPNWTDPEPSKGIRDKRSWRDGFEVGFILGALFGAMVVALIVYLYVFLKLKI